jgi:predicted ester cyclase
MTRDEALALTTRRLDNYNRHDALALAADHAEDSRILSPIFATIQGRRAIEGSYRSLFTAFPDWTMKSEEPIVDGDRIAQVTYVSATHMSELFGLPGTGKRFEFTCVVVLTIADGKIVHERRVYDFTGLLMQIGVLKTKVAKTT